MNNETEKSLLWKFIIDRLKSPLGSIAFIVYFFTVIVVLGLVCSFISLFHTFNFSAKADYKEISLSLIGYSLVMLCSSGIDFIFINFKEGEERFWKIRNGITMIGIASIIFGLLVSIVTYFIPKNFSGIKFFISIIMTLFVWVMWWISNARSLSLFVDLPPKVSDTTGGNAGEENNLQGQIPSDFQV